MFKVEEMRSVTSQEAYKRSEIIASGAVIMLGGNDVEDTQRNMILDENEEIE